MGIDCEELGTTDMEEAKRFALVDARHRLSIMNNEIADAILGIEIELIS